jgi:ribosomal protein S5
MLRSKSALAAAAPRSQLLLAGVALQHSRRALASSSDPSSSTYVAPKDTREGVRRRTNFWSKWGEYSSQAFWQDVGFDHDRTKEMQRSGMAGVRQKKGRPSGEGKEFKELYERNTASGLETEEYFDGIDALGAMEAGGFDAQSGSFSIEAMDDLMGTVLTEEQLRDSLAYGEGPARPGSLSTDAAERRAAKAREALLGDGSAPSRRAELLSMLEDLGPEGLMPPPTMPKEDWEAKRNATMMMAEEMSRNLMTTRNFIDACALRESGMLAEGSWFAYLLNTRRVSKVGPEGKRTSYSCLAVVGNGKGTAGVGMGKDLVAGNALYKATLDARKKLIHVDRFDNRTLFHAVDDRYARTKTVLRLRRPGSGTRCSWIVWKILSAFGISDVSVKIHGSRNPTTVAYAMVNTLQRMVSAQQVAEAKGIRVLDMSPEDVRVPGFGPGTFLQPTRGPSLQ